MKTIKSNTTLTSRSIGDYDCIFTLQVIERKGNWATCKYEGKQRRLKVRTFMGDEYLKPDHYSFAPSFTAI